MGYVLVTLHKYVSFKGNLSEGISLNDHMLNKGLAEPL